MASQAAQGQHVQVTELGSCSTHPGKNTWGVRDRGVWHGAGPGRPQVRAEQEIRMERWAGASPSPGCYLKGFGRWNLCGAGSQQSWSVCGARRITPHALRCWSAPPPPPPRTKAMQVERPPGICRAAGYTPPSGSPPSTGRPAEQGSRLSLSPTRKRRLQEVKCPSHSWLRTQAFCFLVLSPPPCPHCTLSLQYECISKAGYLKEPRTNPCVNGKSLSKSNNRC